MSTLPTHRELCDLAKKWLLRPNSKGGHGCRIALTECRSGFDGEIPDAIGFRASEDVQTVVIEVKTSRSDFLADARKPHRSSGKGMGMWRYFLCPEGIIVPEDLPAGWGLLSVRGARRQIVPLAGPAAYSTNYREYREALQRWRQPCDQEAEMRLLIRVMQRVSDPDNVRATLNGAIREQARLANKCNRLQEELRHIRLERIRLHRSEAGECELS